MNELNNIWNAGDEVNETQLMNYIKGSSSEKEKHLVEQQMANSAFVNEAVEGLKQFKHPGRLDEYVHELNKKLHKHLETKKQKRDKRKIKDFQWIIISLIIILLLCVLGYVVIHIHGGN